MVRWFEINRTFSPDPNQVQIVLKNAKRLIKDANILLSNQRYPLACSVAILAYEEMGKAVRMIVSLNKGENIPWEELFTGHIPKLSEVWKNVDFLGLKITRKDRGKNFLEDVKRYAQKLNKWKQRGFYAGESREECEFWDPTSEKYKIIREFQYRAEILLSFVRDLLPKLQKKLGQ